MNDDCRTGTHSTGSHSKVREPKNKDKVRVPLRLESKEPLLSVLSRIHDSVFLFTCN